MSNNKDNVNVDVKFIDGTSIIFLMFIVIISLIWGIVGFVAFIASIVCLFYNSSTQDKIIGLILGIIAGPFYWIYYIYNLNYCNRFNDFNNNFNNKYY
jgi:hypothetical protein